ncbi:unnamed protein product [Adineta steineri]|uniref:Uncharacterized protein n=1 Tax=Adineta steineri TaxID=433720 RepID=A0A819HUK4_9BILA|nr:unnamed protein product [Adineta steineri]CAF3905583.1 unnamed protein product [Adineta steineri]
MESSLITIKQDRFPSHLSQLIADIRTQLPTHIHYKTTTSTEQGEYVMAERIVIFSQVNNFDVHVVDNITWKRITLTF